MQIENKPKKNFLNPVNINLDYYTTYFYIKNFINLN